MSDNNLFLFDMADKELIQEKIGEALGLEKDSKSGGRIRFKRIENRTNDKIK